MTSIRRLLVCAFVWLALLTAIPASAQSTSYSTDDVRAGGVMFGQLCVTCHGFGGGGGAGPPLTRPKLLNAPDDDALRAVISDGLPERGMPRVRRTTPDELRQLVAYVRSLGATTPAPVKGNAARGAQVYASNGCAACHMVNGQGGVFGPVLSDVGYLRGAPYLRQALVDPGAVLPSGTLPIPSRGYQEYLPVRVVAPGGAVVRGIRLNEDVFTLQMRDQGGKIHSFRKSAVQIQKEEGISLMPSYTDRIKGDDLDDLVAYLATLGGTR
jgi:putative heme-binding domain-containing protein